MKRMRFLSLLLVAVLLLGMLPTALAADPTASLYDLRVNDLEEPLGLDDPTPTFSWKMASEAVGAAQTAYRITVSDKEASVWDSGKIQSGLSTGIVYEGAALQAETAYSWQVTVWDQDGKEVKSDVSTFEMGILDSTQWGDTIQWISASEKPENTHYTVEADIHASTNAVSLIFGMRDNSHFYMPQLRADADGAYFKPHSYAGGWKNELVNLTKDHGIALETFKTTPVHMLIDVTTSTITTFINGKQVHSWAVNPSVPVNGIGQLGIRCTGTDVGYMDNIVITDYTYNEAGTVAVSYDFEDGVNPFGYGTITDGRLVVTGNNTTVLKFDTNEYTRDVEKQEGTSSFRKDFETGKDIVSARLYATALGTYDAFINGERVGRLQEDGSVVYDELKPGSTEAQKRKLYYTYDVTHMLEAGEVNTLSAWVTGGWWIGRIVSRAGGDEHAFAAKLVVSYADGTQDVIVTDTTWEGAFAGPMVYGDIYNGETYDATQSTDWMLPGYEGWGKVHKNTEFTGTVNAHSGPAAIIRSDLERKPQEMYVYSEVTGAASGQYGKVVIDRTYEDGDEITLNPGETLIVDLGQNHSGWEQFVVSGERGSTLKVRHAEILNDDNGKTSRRMDGPEGSIVTFYLRTALTTTSYTLSGKGQESYHPTMTYYGYRYLEFTANKPVTIHSIRSQVLTNVNEDSGSIVTANEKVNRLISNARWGQYSNYVSVPTDCPQRDERYGWLADTQVFATTGAYYSTDTKAFLQKWMQDVRDCQLADGRYQSVAPAGGEYGNNYGRLGWADAGVVVPYNMYVMTGDVSIIEENYASMQLYVDTYLATTNKKGADPGYGDWMAPGDNNDTTVKAICGVAYYAWDALMMAEMAEAIGKSEDAARYLALYETEKAYFIEQFVQADGTLISKRQTPQLFALYLDLLPDEASREAVKADLVAAIEGNGTKLSTGFLGTPILLKVLTEEGLNELAYQLLLQEDNPSWLYSVNNGATTTWERWDSYTRESGFSSSNRSLNHYAYGSVAEWMFSHMAGIGNDPAVPGFKRIRIAPNPDQLIGHVSAVYDSAYGEIRSAWAYENGKLTYTITIPANTTAQLRLPVEQPDTMTYTEEGLTFVELDGSVAVFEAVAGTYTVQTAVTENCYLTLTAGDTDNIPATVTVDGEVRFLPVKLKVTAGQELTLSAASANHVDYTADGWTDSQGNVLSETGELTYTVSGDDELTADFAWTGRRNLAVGAAVSGSQVNDTWKTANLTDGCYNHTQGPAGWSSRNTGKTVFDTPEAVTIDLGTVMAVDRFQIYPRTDTVAAGEPLCFPVDYTIEVSEDGAQWTTVFTETEGAARTWCPAVIQLEQAVDASMIRLTVNAVNQGDDKGNVYVQLAEFGVYNTTDTTKKYVTIDTDFNLPATVFVDGEAQKLPATLAVKAGTELTLSAAATNDVDYSVAAWMDSEGNVCSEADAFVLTVEDDVDLTVSFVKDGPENLAVGAAVTAGQVNDTWKTANLTDGKYTHLDGTNGWSSANAGKTAQLTTPVEVTIDLGKVTAFDRFHIYPRTDGFLNGQTMCFPVSYTISVSEDGSDWEQVYAVENGEVGYWRPVVIELGKTVEGKLIRMHVTAINTIDNVGNAYVQIAEFGVYHVNNPYDVNGDGVVNQLDMTRAQRFFGTNTPKADINGDGTVNIADLILIMMNFYF